MLSVFHSGKTKTPAMQQTSDEKVDALKPTIHDTILLSWLFCQVYIFPFFSILILKRNQEKWVFIRKFFRISALGTGFSGQILFKNFSSKFGGIDEEIGENGQHIPMHTFNPFYLLCWYRPIIKPLRRFDGTLSIGKGSAGFWNFAEPYSFSMNAQ